MLIADTATALRLSVVITLLALALFGALKGRLSAPEPSAAPSRPTLIGGAAAAVAYGLATPPQQSPPLTDGRYHRRSLTLLARILHRPANALCDLSRPSNSNS